MAEVLLVVGGTASFIQIVTTLAGLTKKLNRCLKILRYAPKEVEQLQSEMHDFSLSLQWFCDIAQKWLEGLEGSPEKEVRVEHFRKMAKGCRVVVKGLKMLLRKFFINKSQNSNFEAFIDRIRWYFREPQVKGLRLALQNAKSSVSLFMTLIIFEELIKKIMERERHQRKVPRELRSQMKSLERQLKELVKATKDAQRRLREHAEMTSSDRSLISDTGIQFIIERSEAIEDFVTTTLQGQSRRNRRRSRRRTPSIEPAQSPRHQDPSPDGRLARRRPGDPRMPPLSGRTMNWPEHQTTDSALVHLVDRSTDSPLTGRRSGGSQDAQDIIDITRSPHEDTTASASVWDGSGVSPESQRCRKQKTVGPRIRDNGQEIREYDGEWPSEISGSSQISTDPHNHMIDTLPPLPHPSVWNSTSQTIEQESRQQGQGHDTNDTSISTDNGPIMEESARISKHSGGPSLHSVSTSTPQQQHESLDRSKIADRRADSAEADSSPYKPVPPFNGEERRRPKSRRSSSQ